MTNENIYRFESYIINKKSAGGFEMTDIRSETKRRQDDARELGRSAGKYATDKLKNYLKDKHCLSDDERDEFEKGVKESQG